MEIQEKIKKVCYKYLSQEFDNGTKCSPFDADNSEYHKPRIDYKVSPEMTNEILTIVQDWFDKNKMILE